MNGKILYSCRKCVNCFSLDPQTIEEHLVWNDFLKGYIEWVFHGESMLLSSSTQPLYVEHTSSWGSDNLQRNSARKDDMRGLLRDALGLVLEI